jgi:hypothetical protein
MQIDQKDGVELVGIGVAIAIATGRIASQGSEAKH